VLSDRLVDTLAWPARREVTCELGLAERFGEIVVPLSGLATSRRTFR
jgi:hypothetical protein